jgi:hypothetical protein
MYFVIQLGFTCNTPIIGCSVIGVIVIKRQNNLRLFECSELMTCVVGTSLKVQKEPENVLSLKRSC